MQIRALESDTRTRLTCKPAVVPVPRLADQKKTACQLSASCRLLCRGRRLAGGVELIQ